MARGLFVDAVTRLVPEALHELNALAAQLPDQNDDVVPDPERFELERPLRDWCRKFSFTAVPWAKLYGDNTGITHAVPVRPDWLLDLARQTAHWLRNESGQAPGAVMKMCVTASYRPVDGPPCPNWNIDTETEDAFLDGSAFIEQVAKHMKTRGKTFDPDRYFCETDELMRFDGRTYAVTNQWGVSTQETVDALMTAFGNSGVTIHASDEP